LLLNLNLNRLLDFRARDRSCGGGSSLLLNLNLYGLLDFRTRDRASGGCRGLLLNLNLNRLACHKLINTIRAEVEQFPGASIGDDWNKCVFRGQQPRVDQCLCTGLRDNLIVT
jgi:hypothetical protein